MTEGAQRATLVLEHVTAVDEGLADDEVPDRPWSVVAYLISDGGQRERSTLCRCQTRDAAAEALEGMWHGLVHSTKAPG